MSSYTLFKGSLISVIFTPDFIHKGNYARTHHRDFIMIGFNQGRIDETAKEVLKLIWRGHFCPLFLLYKTWHSQEKMLL